MATTFFNDDKFAALKEWALVNDENEHGTIADLEYLYWTVERSHDTVPWGEERYTSITSAAAAHGITLTATDPWAREHEFWIELPANLAPNDGLEIPAGAFDDWATAAQGAGVKNVVLLGDSIVQGVGATDATTSWAAQLRDSLQTDLGDGGGGFYPLWRPEWAEAGTGWSTVPSDSALDKSLFQYVQGTTGGTSDIYTWTKPAGMTVDSFDIYFCSGPFATPFSYSIDGGAWTNIAGFTPNTNALLKQTIVASVTTSIRIRAANAAGSSILTWLVGIGVNTSTADVVRVHNVGHSADYLVLLDRTTSGDPYAMFDHIVPDLAIVGPLSNDVEIYQALESSLPSARAAYKVDMLNLVAELQGKGSSVLIVKVFEQDRDVDWQAEFRLVIDEVVDETGAASIDFYQLWGPLAEVQAADLTTDNIHPNQNGHDSMATHITTAVMAAYA